MAKNIKINDVTYNAVSSISVPLAVGGGNAVFPDTSDADAVAGDIASGKTGYVNGVKITGTATGGGGIAPATPKDVNFYDYDGVCLYAYTLAEAQALSALPTAPDHSNDTIPLTFQAWNYTLAQVKALTEKADIGATYIPADGKTHLKIRIAAEGRMVVPLYFSQTVSNGVTIDWGDGSSTQKLTGTGNRNTTHTYSSVGDYDITLAVGSGCVLGLGSNSYSYCVLGETGDYGLVYCNMLQEVNVGERVTSIGHYAFQRCNSLASITIPNSVTRIETYTFQGCYSLASITIPNSVTSIETYTFQNCPSLASVTIPNSVTSIGHYAFRYCYSLASITIPNSVTGIGNATFQNCYNLASITIPNSVTSIGSDAFYYCSGMAIYDFSTHTSVPTLASTSAFRYIPSDCIMKIPSALFATWKTATNWSTYASNMRAV